MKALLRFNHLSWLTVPVLTLGLLAGCGDYSGGAGGRQAAAEGPGEPAGPGSGGGTPRTTEAFFSEKVQPGLGICRTCHVPGAMADLADNGRKFMLSADPAQDRAHFTASWTALGGGGASRILSMASGEEAHAGGALWPASGASYRNAALFIRCLADPSTCAAMLDGGITPVPETLPLLGSARGGHLWDSYCAGKADDALLPPDPRTLVRPGIDSGKAVLMNAYWQTCRPEAEYAKTCGEHRTQVAEGAALIAGAGAIGAGSMFSGNDSNPMFATSAETYNKLWQRWGLKARPANFDQMVEERYGTALSPTRNPYPVPGEDPNLTNGGSGQLPMAFTQLREADGRWTGKLGVTCSVCHGGKVGTAADTMPGSVPLGPMYGTNGLNDISVLFGELGGASSVLSVISLNKTRGTGNITNFQLFSLLEITDFKTLSGVNPLLFVAPSTGTEDAPVWWNVGHRSLKFFDGGLPIDATRIELSFYLPSMGFTGAAAQQWVSQHEMASTAWITSLKSPAWPFALDTPLAEQGAVLFHSKNLWAAGLNNPVPKPEGGNGSCASCHGAYSPRFVNDPSFLASPVLEGMAAYVTPLAVIDTDPARLKGNNSAVTDSSRKAWFAYRDYPQCGNQNDPTLRGDRALGYLAPPLYGVWATPPYFHNGSVPSLDGVLDPTQRPALWRRVSKPTPAALAGQVMGYDTDLSAYDSSRGGWRYETLTCGSSGTTPYLDCTPGAAADPILQQLLSQLYGNGGILWNIANLPIMTREQIENRKVYNTGMYSQSNRGHAFTSVLTVDERRALIEYLKTL